MKPTVNFHILIIIVMKIMIAMIFFKFAFVKISYKTQNDVLDAILTLRHKMLVESLLLGSSTQSLTLLQFSSILKGLYWQTKCLYCLSRCKIKTTMYIEELLFCY